MMNLEKILNQLWYKDSYTVLHYLLRPFSLLYFLVSQTRKVFYKKFKWLDRPVDVPILVIGNLCTGGGGKTPVVIETVKFLKSLGFNPCVISRGYKRETSALIQVGEATPTQLSGDEPKLIYKKTLVPVIVHSNRLASLKYIKDKLKSINVIVSDDGLQHYRMPRDFEVIVQDGRRGNGNGWLIPAGPMREPEKRLNEANVVLIKAHEPDAPQGVFLHILQFRNLKTGVVRSEFKGESCYAIAGIADPESFYQSLDKLGVNYTPVPFSDHHSYTVADFEKLDDKPCVMTEKDAVKCDRLDREDLWICETIATLPPLYQAQLTEFMKGYGN